MPKAAVRSPPSRAFAALLLACAATTLRAQEVPLYKDPSAPFEKRAADLVSRMTLQEKADQMQVNAPPLPRLGLPACHWGLEALHGFNGGTIYPDGMALAATWDPALLHRAASAIADEARSRSGPGPAQSVILFGPTVNMARDPRWGRNGETYGEDPYLSSRLAVAFVTGLQGDDPKYLKTIATPKHFCVYSMEQGKQSSDARVSERAMREYYLPVFQACFTEGHAMSTMGAYNAINGVPCCANDWLLTDLLRGEWRFDGAVISDSGAVQQLFTSHRYTDNAEQAVAVAINAGIDVILGGGGGPQGAGPVSSQIIAAVNDGLVSKEIIDRAVTRSMLIRLRLGQLDPPESVPFSRIASENNTPLALQTAREDMVLLQNDPAPKGYGIRRLLPLDLRTINSIAVIGPNAPYNLYGSYFPNNGPGGPPQPTRGGFGGAAAPPVAGGGRGPAFSRGPTPLEAIKAALGDRIVLRTAPAGDTESSLEAARESDAVIFIGGLNTMVERNGTDRASIEFPYDQRALLERVVRANPLTILVMEGASPIGMEGIKDKVPAILMMWYAGEQGGTALADVLLGQYNPAGRLPVTFYRSATDLPPMEDYEVTSGRTYMYLKRPASFAFGHGLSYTTFKYDNFRVLPPADKAAADAQGTITAMIDVTNTGSRDGDEVVQIYAREVEPAVTRPIKQLVSFERVNIPRGATRSLKFSIPVSSLAYWDTPNRKFVVRPGAYEFMAAAGSDDVRAHGTIELK